VASLAWPVVLGQLGLIGMGVVDMVMVGRLGPDHLGALGIGNTLVYGSLLVGLGTASGIDPLVAQAYGGSRPTDAGRALIQGSIVVAAVSVPIAAVHWWAGTLLTLLRQPAALVDIAQTYCQILTFGIPILLAFSLLRRFLQGSGRMQQAMWAILLGNIVNALADYALIYGHWGMPAMGVAGAAVSTVTVRCVMLAALFAMAWSELKRAWPGLAGSLEWRSILAVAAIALPVGAQLATEVWAFGACTVMAGWLGRLDVAAHTAALNIASVTFMIPLGISAAASTRVGNLVGANHRWQTAAWTAVGLAAFTMALSSALLLLVPGPLARIYLDDPAAVALTAATIPLAALFQFFDGTQVACFGVLRGLGDTRIPFLYNVVGFWMLGLPLGYALAFGLGWGLAGVWTGLAVALAIVASLLLLRVRWHHGRPVGAVQIPTRSDGSNPT